MTLFSCKGAIKMSDNKPEKGQGGRIQQRHLRRSKTISVSEYVGNGSKNNNEASINDEATDPRSPSPPPQPTSSCLALKHAVSALTRIDDFILEELGCGFYANVYKATHRVTNQEMVMKINKDSANRPNALREVQLMNRLSHPNILRFLGVCVHEGQLHALTEFISGGTLDLLLANKDEELPWTLRIKLSLDIAKGMHYLHMEGVFHRDLTSKNVLIRKGENRNYQAVLADFGLATRIPDPKATEPLPAVGCPWWMAPEVIYGKFYDQRADLFSYGIILMEITTRIDADPETMPRTEKFGIDYMKICEMVEYCPLDFLQLAFKCCQILPEKRPSSSVIISTLEQIYKSLHANSLTASGKLHKRSRSEDNIIQSSDSLTGVGGVEEIFMTPQIIAQAMTKYDPHYCPANANPFANISRFKDGHKVHDFPRQRKCSTTSNGSTSSGKVLDSAGSVHNGDSKQESQSLPSSPIMLRKAAEKLHQASLHGSDAVQTVSQHELRFSASSDNQESGDSSTAGDRRARFGCNRTRSLGSLDFWNPNNGPGALRKGRLSSNPKYASHSEKTGYCNRSHARIRESSVEDQLESGMGNSSEGLDEMESFESECDANGNHSMASNTYHSLYTEDDGTSSAAPYGSCDESLSSCSLSSFVSCGDIAEEDTFVAEENIDKLIAPCVNDEKWQGLKQRKIAVCDVNRPDIALENGSFKGNHFSLEADQSKQMKNGKDSQTVGNCKDSQKL